MPPHKTEGTAGIIAIQDGDEWLPVLKGHFDMLLGLGEVRATQVMAAFVDGVQVGHTDHEDTVDMVYLPISMGYHPCYHRNMKSLGYHIST